MTATDTLVNRGVIDGVTTDIQAATLHNLGTGRIYGDDLSIGAAILTNLAEEGLGATIAARNRLDIGARIVDNREHALLFSAADAAIGGALDANRRASGRADTINNASATIEALGSLSSYATQVNNFNDHFSIELGPSSAPEPMTFYQGAGSPIRHPEGATGVWVYNDESDHLHAPERNYEQWSRFDLTRTTQQRVVVVSDPARMLAGGDIAIGADTVLNYNSHVIAGGSLAISAASLLNPETLGQRITREVGTSTYFWRDRQKGRDRTGSRTIDYTPPDTVETISLSAARLEQQTTPAGSGTSLIQARTSGVSDSAEAAGAAVANVNPAAIVNVLAEVSRVDSAIGQGAASAVAAPLVNVNVSAVPTALAGVGPLSTASGRGASSATPLAGPGSARVNPIIQVTLPNPSASSAEVVRTTSPLAQVPNTSLFLVHPHSTAGYLIETDPRFASYRQWLSSDYMLGQMQLDPATTQKRLGDGFYEQRLVREQIAQLTGRRFLADYTSDDAQYRALMDAGLTYAKAYSLRPGIALSAEQGAPAHEQHRLSRLARRSSTTVAI